MNNNGERSLFSTISLLCSGLSFLVFPFILGLVSIICGVIGISNQEYKKGLAVCGIIISIISILCAARMYNLI